MGAKEGLDFTYKLIDKGYVTVTEVVVIIAVAAIVSALVYVSFYLVKFIREFLDDHKKMLEALTEYMTKMLEDSNNRFDKCMTQHYTILDSKCMDISSKLDNIKTTSEDIKQNSSTIKDTVTRTDIKIGGIR